MNEYRSTINLPECPRFQTAMFPDTPRTAVLVADGVLVPVVRSIMDPVDVPGFVEPVTDLVGAIHDEAAANPDRPVVVRGPAEGIEGLAVVEIPVQALDDDIDEAPGPKPAKKAASKKRASKAAG